MFRILFASSSVIVNGILKYGLSAAAADEAAGPPASSYSSLFTIDTSSYYYDS